MAEHASKTPTYPQKQDHSPPVQQIGQSYQGDAHWSRHGHTDQDQVRIYKNRNRSVFKSLRQCILTIVYVEPTQKSVSVPVNGQS